MFGRLLQLLRGRGQIIKGTGKLPEGEARKVDLGDVVAGGTQVILCRMQGELQRSTRSVRTGEGGRIAPGPLIDGKYVRCPLHAYKFDPKTGANVGALCANAKTYRVREKDGDCEIWT